jgi:hypothetical protein
MFFLMNICDVRNRNILVTLDHTNTPMLDLTNGGTDIVPTHSTTHMMLIIVRARRFGKAAILDHSDLHSSRTNPMSFVRIPHL